MKRKKSYRPNEITVIAQTSIELFPVVTCERKSCPQGYASMQPTLIVDGEERYYMHHLGAECINCDHCHELWRLNLQALA